MDERAQLKELLLSKSYRKGIFTLTSGKTSDFYVDGKQTTLSAQGAYESLGAFFRTCATAGPDRCAFATPGASAEINAGKGERRKALGDGPQPRADRLGICLQVLRHAAVARMIA